MRTRRRRPRLELLISSRSSTSKAETDSVVYLEYENDLFDKKYLTKRNRSQLGAMR